MAINDGNQPVAMIKWPWRTPTKAIKICQAVEWSKTSGNFKNVSDCCGCLTRYHIEYSSLVYKTKQENVWRRSLNFLFRSAIWDLLWTDKTRPRNFQSRSACQRGSFFGCSLSLKVPNWNSLKDGKLHEIEIIFNFNWRLSQWRELLVGRPDNRNSFFKEFRPLESRLTPQWASPKRGSRSLTEIVKREI